MLFRSCFVEIKKSKKNKKKENKNPEKNNSPEKIPKKINLERRKSKLDDFNKIELDIGYQENKVNQEIEEQKMEQTTPQRELSLRQLNNV